MKKGTKRLVDKLLGSIYTTSKLKRISEALEAMAEDDQFKKHCDAIVTDDALTDVQKLRQLSYLLENVEVEELQKFFLQDIKSDVVWLFSKQRIDYFDKFVQEFQLATEEIGVVFLTSAIDLATSDLQQISRDLSESFGYKVMIRHDVAAEILGGVQLKVENLIFDYSLRTKLQQFQRKWLSSLKQTEKEIGRNQQDALEVDEAAFPDLGVVNN